MYLFAVVSGLELDGGGPGAAPGTAVEEAEQEDGHEQPVGPVEAEPEHPPLVHVAQQQVCTARRHTLVCKHHQQKVTRIWGGVRFHK